MPYTELFYKNSEQGISYQSQPSHAPDLDRFLQNRPDFWISPHPGQIKTPKTLILTDWRLLVQTEEELAPLIAALQECLSLGFEIYLPQKGQLIPLSSENLNDLKSLFQLESITQDKETLIQLAAQQGIAQDELHWLDDNAVNYLLAGEIPLKRALSHRLLKRLAAAEDKAIIWRALQSETPPYELILDDCFPKDEAAPELLSYAWKRAPYEEARLHPKDISALLDPSTPRTLDELSLVHTLILDYINTLSLEVMEHLPALHSLFLSIQEKDYLELYENSLPKIKKIHFIGTPSAQSLQNVLKAAPLLASIEITTEASSVYSMPPKLFLEDGPYKNLKKINIDTYRLSLTNLQSLLNLAPHIKHLDLSNYHPRYLQGVLSLEKNSLAQLEELHLSPDKGNQVNSLTKRLILAAPNLKRFFYNAELSIFNQLEENSLLQLERIVTLYRPDTKTLEKIMKVAPNLKFINNIPIEELKKKTAAVTPSSHFDLPDSRVPLTGKSFSSDQTAYPAASHGSTDVMPSTHKSDIKTVDSDTQHTPKNYHLNQTFYPIGAHSIDTISHIRQSVYQTPQLASEPFKLKTHQADQAFTFGHTDDMGFAASMAPIRRLPKDTYQKGKKLGATAYAKKDIWLTEEWQSLPSLSPEDILLAYHIDSTAPVELQYSHRDNLYYIRSRLPVKVAIDFLVKTPLAPPTVNTLPKDVQDLVQFFLSWPSKDSAALDMPPGPHLANDYLDAMMAQRKGACRHRAVLFKRSMELNHPELPVRIITNDCHAFAEVLYNKHWVQCDLGGYEATLNINKSYDPRPASKEKAAITHSSLHYPKPKTVAQGITPASPSEDNAFFQFKLWEKPQRTFDSIQALCQTWFKEKPRLLIETHSTLQTEGLIQSLKDEAHARHRPVFYIHSPEDIHCSTPSMHLNEDNSGVLKKGPGGPLHAFLTTHPNGLIIVNYDHFKPADLVRFNSLIDDGTRYADGTPLDPKTQVIGLRNTSLDSTPGADFYSRFDTKDEAPSISEWINPLPPIPTQTETQDSAAYPIKLYHATDWKQQLFGRWTPKESGWIFEEGSIEQAKKYGFTTLSVEGGLWRDPEFCECMRTLIHEEQFTLLRHDHVDLETLRSAIRFEVNPDHTQKVVLNPQTLGTFFTRYSTTETHDLIAEEGVIKAASGSTLPIYLTHDLSKDHWQRLLDEALAYRVKLKVYPAPGVRLPEELGFRSIPLADKDAWHNDATPREHTIIIQSTDSETTIHGLLKTYPNALVIDISECQAADVLTQLHAKLIDEDPPRLYFTETESDIKKALLKEKRPVIFKGDCSSVLAQELAPFLLQTRTTPLMIVSPNPDAFSYLPMHRHEVTREEKKEAFIDTVGAIPAALTEDNFESDGLDLLQAKARFFAEETLPWATVISDKNLDTSSSDAFFRGRKELIDKVLRREPYVFISGISGTGKSTFVQQYFKSNEHQTLYQGLEQLLAFATDTSDKQKYLFIDEANLSPSEWRLFSGLFNKPPTLLIDGKIHPLNDHHKLIFAGNPLSYKKGRKEASFFQVHAHLNKVEFHPLPPIVLFEQILKPVFENTLFEPQAESIAAHILKLYQAFTTLPTPELLISPRELQMMALLTVAYCSEHPEDNPEEVAAYFAYHVSKPLIPAEYQHQFSSFKTDFKLKATFDSAQFVLTESRQTPLAIINEHLHLHELRTKAQNPQQRQGGLGGLLLEGEPGLGKSHLLIEALLHRGYQKITHLDGPVPQKAFFQLPPRAALDPNQRLELFKKAFHLGLIVIIDEINTLPLPEEHLNAYLMGHTPEGGLADKPGFMVFATQNPISMPGRQPLSKAIARRLTALSVEPYNPQEMTDILSKMGLTTNIASRLIQAYQRDRDFAIKHHCSPTPTFRDLKKRAKDILHAQQVKFEHNTAANQGVESYRDAIKALRDSYTSLPWWKPTRWFFPRKIANTLALFQSADGHTQPNVEALLSAIQQTRSFFKNRFKSLKTFMQNTSSPQKPDSSTPPNLDNPEVIISSSISKIFSQIGTPTASDSIDTTRTHDHGHYPSPLAKAKTPDDRLTEHDVESKPGVR